MRFKLFPFKPDSGATRPTGGRLLRDDTRFALVRIAVFQYASAAVMLFLLAGFWILQVRDHEINSELAERNRIKTVRLDAPRGKILDRDGRVIVDNQPAFGVNLSREILNEEHLPAIADGLNIPLEDLQNAVRRYASRPRYVPIRIKTELTAAELAFVESHRDQQTFPELDLVEFPRRLYPKDGLAAHVLGYSGEVSDQELDSPEFAKYTLGDRVGKTGLERQYNEILMGVDGEKRVEVDSLNRERRTLDNKDAVPGQNLQTTLDLDLEVVADLALEGKRGAVVAIDPRNGEVLAMVSKPAFDPNLFNGRIRASDFRALLEDPFTPLLNRAIQAQFAPGSTFKPIVALTGLETGVIDPHQTVTCTGGMTLYGRYTKCDATHGVTDMHRSIVHSCDVYFYIMGNRIGIDNIASYASLAGIGKKTGIDLPAESPGLMPSREWKVRTQRERWYDGETSSVAIGQGAVTVTPVQLASTIGGLAMGGVWFKPHLLKSAAAGEPRRAQWNQENVSRVVSGMYGVVNEGGTGASAAIPGIPVAGKTGSAQRISNELAKANRALANELKDNGWFVAFAPRDNPEIVVAVLLEGGLHGAFAAPTARDVIKAYFDKKARGAKQEQPLAFNFPLDKAVHLLNN